MSTDGASYAPLLHIIDSITLKKAADFRQKNFQSIFSFYKAMANDVDAGNKTKDEEIDIKSVLAFLQKRGLKSTENILRNELEGGNSTSNSSVTTGSSGMNNSLKRHNACLITEF